ncbi:MAG: hypothetical protein JRH01_03060 [Deltaproteobacteria bacterium]|nr:hypothetical protein [Deltaproteobacteria bacterium]MBW2393201.1 hypothetical protein [Deltaproteobacteria bacterium]
MSAPNSEDPRTIRWKLIRDLLVFVSKASLEALRDLALIPAALIAGIAGLMFSPSRPERYFHEILKIGDQFDDFVDLFGKQARGRRGLATEANEETEDDALRADDVFDRIENLLVEEYHRGGVTAQVKEAIDRGLDVVQEAVADSTPALRAPDSEEDRGK